MSSPSINPQDLQVLGPQQEQAQQPQPVVTEQPPEDRLLSVDEVENLLRGEPIGGQEPETPEERDQGQMATEFFQGIPPDAPQAPREPGTPAPQLAPGPPTQEQMAQMAQQTLQQPVPQVAQAAVQQQGPVPQQVPVQQGVQQVPQGPIIPQPQLQVPPAQAAMQMQMQQMSTELQSLRQQVAQSQAAPAPVNGQAQQAAQEQTFSVPSEYVAALGSEDPRIQQQALNGLLNGMAQTMRQQFNQEIETRMASIPQVVEPMLENRAYQQKIQSDMYGTYPELSSMTDQVVAVASQLQSQGLFPQGQWSEDLRDAIAERLAPMAPAIAPRVQQNRATRQAQLAVTYPQYAASGAIVPQIPQNLPQVPQQLPPGVSPVGVVGGVHGAQPQVGAAPVMVRDQFGNLVPLQQPVQHVAGGPQSRPGGVQIDQGLQDIWNTLSYS